MPLQHKVYGSSWYKAMHEAGYNFGPLFQKVLEIESLSGCRDSRSMVSLTPPLEDFSQSYYPLHPVCLDGCLQTVVPSLWAGNRAGVNAVLIPAIIDGLVINAHNRISETGLSISSATYTGLGRIDDNKNYKSDLTVYDTKTKALLFQVSGLRYHKLDVALKTSEHSYGQLYWQPDITFLKQENVFNLACFSEQESPTSDSLVNNFVDMIVHKIPNLNVMEINIDPNDNSSLWFNEGNVDMVSKRQSGKYHLSTTDTSSLISLQETYGNNSNSTFSLLHLNSGALDFGVDTSTQDLVVIKMVRALEILSPQLC